MTSPVPTPTQVKHPWRTLTRSAVQALPMIAVIIPTIVGAAQDNHIGWVEVWGPSAVAASAVIVRVMAIPQVNEALTRLGLGAEPKPDGGRVG
jgi:ABC-type enterochelin transport system permease subunit